MSDLLLNATPSPKAMEPEFQDAVDKIATSPVDSPAGYAPELFHMDSEDQMNPVKTEAVVVSQELVQDEQEQLADEMDKMPAIDFDQDLTRRESTAPSTLERADTTESVPDSSSISRPRVPGRQTKLDKNDPRHSSKNEGVHTDRRYLCYICHKLFTRRRSVRDHIAKIHNTKTWEPVRSLEIIVEPNSGEPLDPLEEQIARGGAPPLEKTTTGTSNSKRGRGRDRDSDDEDDIVHTTLTTAEAARDKHNELHTSAAAVKAEPSFTDSRPNSVEPFSTPAPLIGKKRPLAITKKGTARIKSSISNKRPRLAESETSTPFRSPSVASGQRMPTSKLARLTASPSSSRAQSIDVSASPSPSAASIDSTNDDGEVFCICRRGDNHTWMIACDGQCEEWYHGKCVNIRERDGDLIDKYICPRCTREGFQTTWKRMCRRKECRKPARVFDDPPSKYCSPDCGRMFFVELIKRGDPDAVSSRNGQYIIEVPKKKKTKKKRRKDETVEKKKRTTAVPGDITPMIDGNSRPHTPAYSDDDKSEYETDSSADEQALPNRGGALRAGEVKALLEQCKTIEQWRNLGRKPATPPREPDIHGDAIKHEGEEEEYTEKAKQDAKLMIFDDFETHKLESIATERALLAERTTILAARETLLELIKKRSAGIMDEVKKFNPKWKEICGFDPRVAWTEEEFTIWWRDCGGKEVIESGRVGLPPVNFLAGRNGRTADSSDEKMNGVNGTSNGNEAGSRTTEDDVEGGKKDGDNDSDDDNVATKGGICVKNRCQRHGSNTRWQKSGLAELKFEQELIRRAGEKLDGLERGIKERAVVRGWERRGEVLALQQ